MLIWLLSVIGLGFAGELEIERGRAALAREAFDEARNLALASLQESPRDAEAQQLYIEATSAAGFGSRALRELAEQPTDTPAYVALEDDLRGAIAEGESKGVKTSFKRLFDEHPAHPDRLAPIWRLGGVQGRLLQLRVQRRYLTGKAMAKADLVALYRTRRLAAAADRPEWVTKVDEVLAERGEPPILAREPFDRIERTRYAESLAKTGGDLAGYPSELVDVTDRAARLLFLAGRFDRAADLYQQLQRLTGAPEAWSGEADAWRRAGELPRAREVADEAIAHATDPRNIDLGASNAELQRATLARAFLVSAEIHEAAGDTAEGQIDLAIAHLFARRVLDDKLAERLAKARRPLDAELQTRFMGRREPAASALAAARRSDDPAVVLAHVRDVLLLSTMGTRGSVRIARNWASWSEPFALPLLLRSRAAVEQDRVRLARSYAVMATLLDPDPFWWAERAGLQQQLGERDAAFVSYATGRGLGVPELDTLLGQTWSGLGDWRVAADLIGSPPPAATASESSPTSRPDTVSTEPLPRPRTAPRLGEPMPSFVIDTESGRLDSTFLRGRIVVLSFFDAECDACLQMLPQFGTVARRLRDRGLDAVVIAVSLDEDPEEYERVIHLGGRWGEVVHKPELGRRFGIERLPSTWLIDTSGIARFYIDHWISGDELIDYIGQIR